MAKKLAAAADRHRRADRLADPPRRPSSAQTLIGLGLNKLHRTLDPARHARRCAA